MSEQFVKWHGDHIMRLAAEHNMKAMMQATIFFKREVKIALSKAGTGRSYKRRKKKGKGQFHIASVAGATPAPDTGILMSSISRRTERKKYEIRGFVGSDLDKIAAKADVGTDLEYGFYLEVGTKNMAARPYLRPTLMANRKKILEFFKKATE